MLLWITLHVTFKSSVKTPTIFHKDERIKLTNRKRQFIDKSTTKAIKHCRPDIHKNRSMGRKTKLSLLRCIFMGFYPHKTRIRTQWTLLKWHRRTNLDEEIIRDVSGHEVLSDIFFFPLLPMCQKRWSKTVIQLRSSDATQASPAMTLRFWLELTFVGCLYRGETAAASDLCCETAQFNFPSVRVTRASSSSSSL